MIHSSYASLDFSPRCKESYKLTLELQMEKALDIIEKEKTFNSSNALIYYNESYLNFLKVLIQDKPVDYDDYLELSDIGIEKIGTKPIGCFLYFPDDVNRASRSHLGFDGIKSTGEFRSLLHTG